MKTLIYKTNRTIQTFNKYMDRFEQQMLKLSNLLF